MKILHTSDWHLGRTFHGANVTEHLRTVLGSLVSMVREETIDVVLISGDVFDHASPAASLYDLYAEVLADIRAAGAHIVLISGNHDSPSRLGHHAAWARSGGVHVLTRPDAFRSPVTLSDDHGPVDFYGIPFLDPVLVSRHLAPEADAPLRWQREALGYALQKVAAQVSQRQHRSVVLSHCFASTGASASEADLALNESLQRDITVGGLDLVPASLFDVVDYAALGHIHSRHTLADTVRYSGAPLHFSFSEADKPRGVWIVTLDAGGVARVDWRDLPVPRPLSRLQGTLDALLTDPTFATQESHWLEVTLTDPRRPVDAMRRLQERFPYAARIRFAPSGADAPPPQPYADRVRQPSTEAVVDAFLEFVRDGQGIQDDEREIIRAVIAEATAEHDTHSAAPGETR